MKRSKQQKGVAHETKTERLSFSFRSQPSAESLDGILFGYLNAQPPDVKNEMVLRAIRTYWLAEAYQAQGKKRGQELKRLAEQMIFCLEGQIFQIRLAFDLPIPLQTSAAASAPSPVAQISEPEFEEDEEQEDWDSVPVISMDGI
jgi:hypothetical protein